MELSDINKILVVDLGGIGDLLLAQPALRALRRKYPQAVIDMLVVGRCAPLIRSYGFCDHVFVGERNFFNFLPVLGKLRRSGYDLAINMRTMVSWPGAIKMFMLFSCISARISAGRDTNKKGFFFSVKVPETDPGSEYEMEYDIDTVAALGAQVSDRTIRLPVEQESRDKAEGILQTHDVQPGDLLIGIHPGGMPSRRWPLDNYRRLMERIYAACPAAFAIIGGGEEKTLANELRRGGNYPVIDMTGSLSIQETAALIQRCMLFISNDTGTMHIAAVMGTPQVAIFGPGQLTRFDPRNISPKATVVYKKTGCAPCGRYSCRSMKCFKEITVAEVLEAALGLLKQRK